MDLKDFDDGKDKGKMGMVKIGSAGDLANAIYEIVHHSMAHNGSRDGMVNCEIAGAGSLGALVNLALTICKKPAGLDVGEIPKEAAHKVFASLRTETFVFASLMAAHQYSHSLPADKDHVAFAAEFSVKTFGLALAAWQKIYPDQNIEDYLEPPVVDIARQELNKPENYEFNVEKEFNQAFVLKNNGSIN